MPGASFATAQLVAGVKVPSQFPHSPGRVGGHIPRLSVLRPSRNLSHPTGRLACPLGAPSAQRITFLSQLRLQQNTGSDLTPLVGQTL